MSASSATISRPLGLALALALASGAAQAAPPPDASPERTTGEAHLDRSRLVRGCASCHRGHGAPRTPMLPGGLVETCLACHGDAGRDVRSAVAPAARGRLGNVRAELAKPYRHPVETGVLHRRDEVLPSRTPGAPRHVSCVDCHDAHRPRGDVGAEDGLHLRPRAASLRGVAYEYELCYRCHGEGGADRETRDVRSELYLGNASFHPVEGPGHAAEVPSLLPPFTVRSVLGCTDCHGSDEASGLRGVHGSTHAGLLVAAFSTRDGQPESELSYRLCYRCHDRASILSNRSFSQHGSHLQDPEAQTSCRTCHNPHGSRENAHLVDFNQVVVAPTRAGLLLYRSTGRFSGQCFLTCHGAEHAPGRYCPVGTLCERGRITRGVRGTSSQGLSAPSFGPGFPGLPSSPP